MELNKQTMIDSYRNISFNGERRGEQDYLYYSELLKTDLTELGENIGNYEVKFVNKVMDYFHKQSRTASSFITGPANFPVSSNIKKMDVCDRAYEHFKFWREKYFKAVNRVRTLSPEAELDLIATEIDQLELDKENYESLQNCDSVNLPQLIEDLFPDIDDYYKKDFIERGVTYQIPSIKRKILARKKKILIMKNRIETKDKHTDVFFQGGKIFIENDRVIISHNEKPDKETIQAIKKNGFRWSPKMGNWCRKHTANARYSANCLLNNVFGGEIT